MVYLNFVKAFDKVDHRILLRKQKKAGIKDKIGDWIHGFLTKKNADGGG